MFRYIWEFIVQPERQADVEAAYGPGGDWDRLFRRDPAFLRTELLRDLQRPDRLITVDYWTSRGEYSAFRERFHAEYGALDTKCDEWTVDERHLGDFVVVA